jgi:hypothetical protein
MGEQRVLAKITDKTSSRRSCGHGLPKTKPLMSLPSVACRAPLAKLIAATPVRSFSRMSLGSTLAALCLKLQVVV